MPLISVVAANWGSIPGAVKLFCYLFIQSLLGFLVWKSLAKPGVAREASIVLFSLLFFAGIGLTAQVFNISSSGYSGLFFWAGLALPVTLLSNNRFLNYFWYIVYLAATVVWTFKISERMNYRGYSATFCFFMVFSIYLYHFIGLVGSKRLKLPVYFSEALRVLSFLIIFLGGTVVGTVLWYSNLSNTIGRSESEYALMQSMYFATWIGSFLVAIPFFSGESKYNRSFAVSFTILLFLIAAFVSLPLILQTNRHEALGAIFSIVIWATAAIAAAHTNQRRLFDFLTLAIAMRALVIYFEVFGSMMATGIGLIISGCMVLFLSWVWYRFRSRLAN